MLGWWIYHKLARAETHIDAVESEITQFLATHPFRLANEFTPNADSTLRARRSLAVPRPLRLQSSTSSPPVSLRIWSSRRLCSKRLVSACFAWARGPLQPIWRNCAAIL